MCTAALDFCGAEMSTTIPMSTSNQSEGALVTLPLGRNKRSSEAGGCSATQEEAASSVKPMSWLATVFNTDNPRLLRAKCANLVLLPGAAAMAVVVVVVTVFVASRILFRPARERLEMLGRMPLPDASRGGEGWVPRAAVKLATVAAMTGGAGPQVAEGGAVNEAGRGRCL